MTNLTQTQKKEQKEKKIAKKMKKAFYKLMNNAMYGKTMEKLRDRIDVRFASNKKYYLK